MPTDAIAAPTTTVPTHVMLTQVVPADGGQLVRRPREFESSIVSARAHQNEILNRLIHTFGGGPEAGAWLAAHMDIAPETALQLLTQARCLPSHPMLFAALAHGDMSFDRATELVALSEERAAHTVDNAWMHDIAQLRRLREIASVIPPMAGAPLTTSASAHHNAVAAPHVTATSGA